ncbi:MAG: hypothetical protein K1W16_07615 [Lachnospiraceae bacterium]
MPSAFLLRRAGQLYGHITNSHVGNPVGDLFQSEIVLPLRQNCILLATYRSGGDSG